MHREYHNADRSILRDIILGGQDGLVNVLGIILAVATATLDTKLILIAGMSATFAESLSMAAVAYTSSKAAKNQYEKELLREKWEIENVPEMERNEIREIYYKKGFRGELLDKIVKKITSSKKVWLDEMMRDELQMSKEDYSNPGRSALIVGIAALIGSLIPIIPFFFMSASEGVTASGLFFSNATVFTFFLSMFVLFAAGAYKARITVGTWWKSGLEIMLIGLGAAVAGYVIGVLLSFL